MHQFAPKVQERGGRVAKVVACAAAPVRWVNHVRGEFARTACKRSSRLHLEAVEPLAEHSYIASPPAFTENSLHSLDCGRMSSVRVRCTIGDARELGASAVTLHVAS